MNNHRTAFVLSFLALSQLPSLSIAQDTKQLALPDPATIIVPDVAPSSDPKVAKQGHKFFYFNNSDITFEQAYSDLAECRQHLATGAIVMTPSFVPWVEPVNRKSVRTYNYNPAYGLAGAVIGSVVGNILLNHLERGQRANKMRRCMEPRGYKRYAIEEKSWETLNGRDEAQILLMQAKIGSAPKPVSGEVTE
jgi:hypothetical protein